MKHIQFIILLLITTVSFSQEIPQALNLQEAIDYALQNNRVAKNAQRDIEAAPRRLRSRRACSRARDSLAPPN